MPRARVRSPRRKSRTVVKSRAKKAAGKPAPKKAAASRKPSSHPDLAPKLKMHRFVGVSLGGGKTDKTSIAVIEYYPTQKKIFLGRLFDKIATEGELSGDAQIHQIITDLPGQIESVAFDVPLTLPKFFTANHKTSYEDSQEPEILWMWKHYRALAKKKSPPRLFTPYTERCVEQYLQTELEEPFHLQHALGSNMAPLTARARYLTRRLDLPTIEVFPKLTLWRIGSAFHIPKSQLRFHRHWDSGTTARQNVIHKMMDKNLAFIYDQDVKTLVESPQAFDAFLCALTGLLNFTGVCEPRPKGFPKGEGWIAFPRKVFPWP